MVVRRRRHNSNGSTSDAILGGRGINRNKAMAKEVREKLSTKEKPEIYKRKEGKEREGEGEGRREETRFFPPPN